MGEGDTVALVMVASRCVCDAESRASGAQFSAGNSTASELDLRAAKPCQRRKLCGYHMTEHLACFCLGASVRPEPDQSLDFQTSPMYSKMTDESSVNAAEEIRVNCE